MLLSKLLIGSTGGPLRTMPFWYPNVALPSLSTYRYDADSFRSSIACQSAPTPTIHVSSLVCEFQLYDAVPDPGDAWNGGANGL